MLASWLPSVFDAATLVIFALIGAIGAATVQKADAACGFYRSQYYCR